MLTKYWTPLRPHKIQSALWRCTSRSVLVAAGRGSGKSELAKRRIVRYLPVKRPWRTLYGYFLPTLHQSKQNVWDDINNLIPEHWKEDVNLTDRTIKTVFGSTLLIYGTDRPERLEGKQYDGIVIDEACDQRPNVYTKSILPMLTHRKGWCWQVGVPKRAGIGASQFRNLFQAGVEGKNGSASFTWPSDTVLSPDELEFFRSQMSEKDFNESFRANWEDNSGVIFYAFDSRFNVKDTICIQENMPLIIGSDFNVDPMAWVIGQRTPDGNFLNIFDELFIRNTSTGETLNALFAKYGQHKAGFEFYGDASGRARRTSGITASQSDYLQILGDDRFKRKSVYYKKKNPAIVDRFAACNGLFKNAKGIMRCFIHPRCRYLISDLEQRAYKPGTREADDTADIGHISDALGYAIDYLFPFSQQVIQPSGRIITIGN